MWKKSLELLLAAAFLANSSGLVMAIHLHEEEADHDSHACSLCLDLMTGRQAVVEDGRVELPAPEPLAAPDPIAYLEPVLASVHTPLSSRAPPAR